MADNILREVFLIMVNLIGNRYYKIKGAIEAPYTRMYLKVILFFFRERLHNF
ncbi:hypothetical protein SAMN05661044_00900 [Olivibacter domesticus]|uniref:Uncharacterized protein n=1 Tax=Olivibacter domesticus TaxID=407022 RepID=A0A1H7J2B0_OLID1|nr:hypothetical protein SAMN05661044_00900 [Olivibacter domesticus]